MQLTDDMTREERIEYWEMVVEDFKASAKTKTAYCQENDIPVSTLSYWENRLQELKQAKETQGGRFVEVPVPSKSEASIHYSYQDGYEFKADLVIAFEGIRVLVNKTTPIPLLADVLKETYYAE